MKKFFALVLALVMAMSLTTMAWGAPVTLAGNTDADADQAYVSSGINSEYAYTVAANETFDGAGYKLTVSSTTAAEDVAIQLTGNATVKNVVIDCANRGIDTTPPVFTAVGTTPIVIDNVTILNSVRAIHIEAATDLNVSNSTFAGKISYDLKGGTATFTNCTFKANSVLASAKGNMVEPWSETVFVNCVFEDDFELSLEDFANAGSGAAVELENCIYDGEPVTAANVDDLFTNVGAFDLATVAPATYTATGTTAVDTKDAKTMAVKGAMVIEMVPAKDAYVATATGNWVPGYVKHYVDEYGTTYVPCTADVEGALYLYYKGTKSVYDVVVAANPVYVAAATEFTNFGTGCGQLDNRADTTAKYYTVVDGNGVKALYQGTTATGVQVLVGDKLVGVVLTDLTNALNDHKWVVEKNAKNEITKATCSLCGQPATWVLNMASIPTGAEFEPAPGGGYLYWSTAPVATEKPSTDKVTSAETFDAGIAMYVGMSVMAAAGSAVVIGKKKD